MTHEVKKILKSVKNEVKFRMIKIGRKAQSVKYRELKDNGTREMKKNSVIEEEKVEMSLM